MQIMKDPSDIIWSPVKRNDVSWNFEKFLIAPDGTPVKRYSKQFPVIDIMDDITGLIKKYNIQVVKDKTPGSQ